MGLLDDLDNLKYWSETPFKIQDETKKSLSKIKLLTPDFANSKTAKNAQFSQYESFILHLSPATIGFQYLGRKGTLCPMASQGCQAACLNTAGRGRFDSIQNSRLRKTLYFILFRDDFMSHLEKEISKLNAKTKSRGKKLVVRLNGTSDIQYELIRLKSGLSIFETFPDVQFYDYTKIVNRLERVKSIENYHVTFSASESNDSHVLKALDLGFNVATVFGLTPKEYLGRPVIDGDSHDFRFLDSRDSKGLIVGLKAKGLAKRDESGFVKCPMLKAKNAA